MKKYLKDTKFQYKDVVEIKRGIYRGYRGRIFSYHKALYLESKECEPNRYVIEVYESKRKYFWQRIFDFYLFGWITSETIPEKDLELIKHRR